MFCVPACEPKLGEIAEALGEDVGGLDVGEAAARGVDAVRRLLRDVGLPADAARMGRRPRGLRHPDARRGRDEEPQHHDEPAARSTRDDLAELYRVVLG